MTLAFRPALAATLLVLAVGCKQAPVDNRAEVEKTIRELDHQWAQASLKHDVDATVAFYADDAHVLPPDAPLATGKADIRAVWVLNLNPAYSLNWEATKVEVAQSGDLAYVTGTYIFKPVSSSDMTPTTPAEVGKMVEVFKKQADGSWKVTADIWNRDTPTIPPLPVRPYIPNLSAANTDRSSFLK